MELTHIDAKGRAKMVDVGNKDSTDRVAIAEGQVVMRRSTWEMIRDGRAKKGDVLGVAQVAGIMAAKKTSELIPMCHAIWISGISMDFLEPDLGDGQADTIALGIRARVHCQGQTGVEMEALTAVSIAALTVYDMCKAVDRGMRIEAIRLVEKTGGKSGHFRAD